MSSRHELNVLKAELHAGNENKVRLRESLGIFRALVSTMIEMMNAICVSLLIARGTRCD